MSNNASSHGVVSSDAVRPLPPKPDLEFERKRAKKLLRQFRRGDPNARRVIATVRATGAAHDGADCQLADAQFAIAREYGFSSWPKLVTFYETWDRHVRGGAQSIHNAEFYDTRVRSILAAHGAHRSVTGQMIATFVPRFYGKRNDEVFAATLTEDEARLVASREARCSTWAELRERAAASLLSTSALYETPFGQALLAIRERNVLQLAAILDAHPDLLHPTAEFGETDSLVGNALLWERRGHSVEARRITDFLISRGADLAAPLNRVLMHQFNTNAADTAYWLDRGADPNWVPPNGISVLEHALLRYWDRAAVDLVASRVVAPAAFWIAAGVGDLAGVLSYFDRNGALTDSARRSRPDFTAVGPMVAPCSPEATDEEILWEVFLVAGLNGRMAVLDALVARGVDIDAAPWGQSLLHFAVGNAKVELVEHLVHRGANLGLKGWHPDSTARELAEWRYSGDPNDPAVSRIYEICRTSHSG